jgi:WD40 repeat protein
VVKQELDDDDLRGVGPILVFSPDGKALALGGGSPLVEKGAVVKLWDLQEKKITTAAKFAAPPLGAAVPSLPVKPSEWWMVQSLAFSPDGTTLAAGEFLTGGKRARIQLYDAKTGEPKRGWEIGESKGMVHVAYTADGKSLVSASGPVKYWDVKDGEEQQTLETNGAEVFRVAVSADGWHLATSGVRKENDKSIREVCVRSAKTGGLLQVVSWEDPSMWATSIAFSPNGMTLAVGAQTDADVRVKGSEKVKGELRLIPLGR